MFAKIIILLASVTFSVAQPSDLTIGRCCERPNCSNCVTITNYGACERSLGMSFTTQLIGRPSTCYDIETGETVEVDAPTTGGDPHFKTWEGHKYDYHGECDLVLLESREFSNSTGIDIHIRTERAGYMSFIERALLKIGKDILELNNQGEFWLNGETGVVGSTKPFGPFQMIHFVFDDKPNVVQVKLSEREWINFEARHNMLYVAVQGSAELFSGSIGMMGHYESGLMLGRDHLTVFEDPDEYALEWQVRGETYFMNAREPQYPQKCKPAGARPSRLGESIAMYAAEKACEWWGEDKDECIFDVVASRNTAVAQKK